MNSKFLIAAKYYQSHTYLVPSCIFAIKQPFSTHSPQSYNKLNVKECLIKKSTLLANNTRQQSCVLQLNAGLKSGAGYTRYAHGRNGIPKSSNFGKLYQVIIVGGACLTVFFGYRTLSFETNEPVERFNELSIKNNRRSAATVDENHKLEVENSENKESQPIKKKSKKSKQKGDEVSGSESEDDSKTEKEEKKPKISFKNRKIIEYENRLREFSTPDKNFRYFATLKIWNEHINDYEIFMKPEDFVRSLTFNDKQPEGLGLDSYQRYDPKMFTIPMNLPEDSVFYKLGQEGLISFSDYIFLLTLLSTPTRHFEIAFKMFDLDTNGNIDINEFEQLQAQIRRNTQVGNRHKDTRMTGSVIKENSALNKYFFGPSYKELLTVQKFTDFQKQLQNEMIKMEFERFSSSNGQMDNKIFCNQLLTYSGFSEKKKKRMLKRVTKEFKDSEEKISFKEYQEFFHLLRHIQEVDTALKFYRLAGASIDKRIFQHVAKTVAGVDLRDHIIDVVFCLFDDNGDNKLSHEEFINVMKKRWLRGLQTPKDTGFLRYMNDVYECAQESFKLNM